MADVAVGQNLTNLGHALPCRGCTGVSTRRSTVKLRSPCRTTQFRPWLCRSPHKRLDVSVFQVSAHHDSRTSTLGRTEPHSRSSMPPTHPASPPGPQSHSPPAAHADLPQPPPHCAKPRSHLPATASDAAAQGCSPFSFLPPPCCPSLSSHCPPLRRCCCPQHAPIRHAARAVPSRTLQLMQCAREVIRSSGQHQGDDPARWSAAFSLIKGMWRQWLCRWPCA